MEMEPQDFVEAVDHTKLDYKAQATMSDGTLYDADNLKHFVEADIGTLAAFAAVNNPDLQKEEARELTKNRRKALSDLAGYLSTSPDYTLAEMALVAKAASKYGVISDKTGRLKMVNLADNNRHPIAIVGRESANAVIGELRKGRSLKDAFLTGLQELADTNAKENRGKNGWQKFAQSDAYEDAVELNAAAAGTPWCTGGAMDFAQSQRKGGDFYIYYKEGRPEVAVRMNGTDRIGEIRGNNMNQGLNKEQQNIAKQFLQTTSFKSAESFIEETERKEALSSLVSDAQDMRADELSNLGEVLTNDRTALDDSRVKKLLSFRTLFGYLTRKVSDKVQTELKEVLAKQIAKDYANGYWAYDTLDASYGDKKDKITETALLGKRYKMPFNKIKAVKLVAFAGTEYTAEGLYDSLEYVDTVNIFLGGELSMPNIKKIKTISVFDNNTDDAVLIVPDGARIGAVGIALGGSTGIVIKGKVKIDNAEIMSRSGGMLNIYAPDAEYVVVPEITLEKLARTLRTTYLAILRKKLREDAGSTDGQYERTEFVGGIPLPIDPKTRKIMSDFYDRLKNVFGINAVADAMAPVVAESTYDILQKFIPALIKQQGTVAKVYALADKQKAAFADFAGAFTDNPFPRGEGRVYAPNIVNPSDAAFTQITESPRYARTDDSVGVHKTKDGFGFRAQTEPVTVASSFVASKPSFKDEFMGNVLGLTGRVQCI
jgi:hypothetical protein